MPFLQTGSLTIHYETAGNGMPLILLHGLGNNSRSWKHQLSGLQEHFQVIAWDTPGYGKSSDPDPEFRTFRELADILKAFLDGLGLQKIHLLGHSMGSALALQFCSMYPEYVEALILAATTLGGRTHPKTNEEKLQNRLRMIEQETPAELARKRVPQTLSPYASDEVRQYAESIMAQVRASGYRSVSYALYHADQTPLLADIKVPTLVICGEDDIITPVKESVTVQQGIKDSKLVLIPQAGHVCYLEQPEAFNTHVRTFLQGVAQSGDGEGGR
ncbi:alpha/beta fold hydrolase [Brevibacillus sp. B_LB10_24]|uniref:alpha/beta fold hydrolase n=1 Tax=Brevibacillus sp. B_LB10_24 TaxID=3380645 RepID=UPI0038B8A030